MAETAVLRCPSCRNVVPVAPTCRVCGEGLEGAEARQAELDAEYGYSLQKVEATRERVGFDPTPIVFVVLSILAILSGFASLFGVYGLMSAVAGRGNGALPAIVVLVAGFLQIGLPLLALLGVRGARKVLLVLLGIGALILLLALVGQGNAPGGIPNLPMRAAPLVFLAAYIWSIWAMGDAKAFPSKF